MNEDLKWLAENVHEWLEGKDYLSKRIGRDGFIFETRLNANYEQDNDMYGTRFTHEQWQAARDELAAHKPWRGPEDGLPPVGSCCEMEFTGGGWHEVKIEHYSRKHVIFTDQAGEERIEYMRSFKFRPIRTEEDKAVEEMASVLANVSDARGEREKARALYHAGYRKQDNQK